jgi:tetratricopeptide (TPR) repeat protein
MVPEYPDEDRVLRLWLSAGKRLLGEGQAEDATPLLERVVLDSGEPSPDPAARVAQRVRLVDTIVHLALAHTETGRYADAEELIGSVVAPLAALDTTADPSLEQLRRTLIRVTARTNSGLGRHELATEQYQQLVRTFRDLDTNDPDVSAELAQCLEDSAVNALADAQVGTAATALNGAIGRWRTLCGVDDPLPRHRVRLIACLRRLADLEDGRDLPREADKLRIEANRAERALKGTPPPFDETDTFLRSWEQ